MNHTDTPWVAGFDGSLMVANTDDDQPLVEIGKMHDAADAAHIVRCVKVHYELVAALEVIALNSADILAGGPNNVAAQHLRIASCALARLQS